MCDASQHVLHAVATNNQTDACIHWAEKIGRTRRNNWGESSLEDPHVFTGNQLCPCVSQTSAECPVPANKRAVQSRYRVIKLP